MKVFTSPSKQIQACVRLPYRGHTISVSNIGNFPTLIVLDEKDQQITNEVFTDLDDVRVSVYGSAENIRKAMNWIDAQLK